MRIKETACAFEPELFNTSFGFKGSALTGVWQTVAGLSDGEVNGIGLGVQSVLWSDSDVFLAYGEEASNRLMFNVTRYALNYVKGASFDDPKQMINAVFPAAYKYARETVGSNVSSTFVLNALVPVDFAAWMLYAREKGFTSFDSIYKGVYKAQKLANIPLITYLTPVEQVVEMAKAGTGIFKIKVGSDPEKDGDLDKMLEWDKLRVKSIHDAVKDIACDYTESKRPVYYLDANGRYDTRERLNELLEFLDKHGILKQTVLFEEPFKQENKVYVGDLPVCIASDESAHSLNDVNERISLGYKAITLKPIAKTLSVTVDMAECARKNNVQCFCADLTVNPVMVEWNKNFASRLMPLKGMEIGVVESNGAQNYRNWQKMKTYLPIKDNNTSDAVYTLSEEFYKSNGGIFLMPKHYPELLKKGEFFENS